MRFCFCGILPKVTKHYGSLQGKKPWPHHQSGPEPRGCEPSTKIMLDLAAEYHQEKGSSSFRGQFGLLRCKRSSASQSEGRSPKVLHGVGGAAWVSSSLDLRNIRLRAAALPKVLEQEKPINRCGEGAHGEWQKNIPDDRNWAAPKVLGNSCSQRFTLRKNVNVRQVIAVRSDRCAAFLAKPSVVLLRA
jgi:hypothetical protein